MKKKVFVLSLLSALGIGLLTSCSGDDNDNNEKGGTVETSETATQTVSDAPLMDETNDSLSNYEFTKIVRIELNGTSATVKNNVSGVAAVIGTGIVNITSTASNVEYIISGTYSGSVNIEGKPIAKVTLNGANITNEKGVALNLTIPKVFFHTVGGTTNSCTATLMKENNAALYCNGKLVFYGKGTLNITSNNGSGISAMYGITAKETTFNIKSGYDGIRSADHHIFLNSGTYNVEAAKWGICTRIIKSGSASRNTDHYIVINGGTYNITTTGRNGNGIWAYSLLTINGGNITISAYNSAIYGVYGLIINGGNTHAKSTAGNSIMAIDLYVKGGTTTAIAQREKMAAILSATKTFVITGGTLIGISANDNVSLPTAESTQPSVVLGKNDASYRFGATLMNIQSSTGGSEVITYQIPQSYTTLFVSSPKLSKGTSYNIYTGGSHSGTSTNGIYYGGTYTKGKSNGSFTTATAAPYVTEK